MANEESAVGIREARPSDLEALAALHVVTFREAHGVRGAPGHALRLDVERLQTENDRRTMFADARAHRRDLALVIVAAVDHDMAVRIGERDEIALGIDHDLLH